MATTKADLERTIAERDETIRTFRAALDKLGRKELIRVVLPWAPHGLSKRKVPYLTGKEFSEPNRFQALVMEPLVELLHRHGATEPEEREWTITAGELNLAESGFFRKNHGILVDRKGAEIVAGMLDGISTFSQECYAAGFNQGSDLLGRLAEGEITADLFEDSRQQELARERQDGFQSYKADMERSIQRKIEK